MEVVDFSKRKPNNGLEICPKCGRTGERRHYPSETFDLIIHRKELQGIFWNVADSCTIKKE